jgi:hypothetical protein
MKKKIFFLLKVAQNVIIFSLYQKLPGSFQK